MRKIVSENLEPISDITKREIAVIFLTSAVASLIGFALLVLFMVL